MNKFFTNTSWQGKVELNFSLRNGKSILAKYKHSGPFVVQRSFYPEEDEVIPHVYLLHPSGGLVGGDKLILDVQLESNSSAFLTNPSASKFYSTNGLYAVQKNTFRLGNNAVLEWMPQSTIFFPKSKVMIDSTFILENNARVISCEILCFNSVVINCNSVPEDINIFLNIDLPRSIGLRERLRISSSDYVIKLGGFKISALLFAIPSNVQMLRQVRQLISQEIDNKSQIGGVTLLEELLIVRLLSNDNQSLSKLIYCIWSIIRPVIVGKDFFIPRVWCM